MKLHLELAHYDHSLLVKFVRMIEYLLLETFTKNSLSEMDRLVLEIEKEDRKSGGLFSCVVIFGEKNIMFNPDKNDVIESVESVLKETVHNLY